jgi:glyoxylase-like metal-dependent hydrolase (beta-lactamase superfamily II)
MRQRYPDLWQTTPEHPFGDRTITSAYLLTRSDGNVLFYATKGTDEDCDQIERLGGIARQYLSHRDEVGPHLAALKQRFGPTIYCHKLDAAPPVDVAFEKREVHLGNIELIPTPGHTLGSTSFHVSSPTGRHYLFTGDSIFPKGDGWGTYVSRRERSTLASSLQLLRDLPVDVVFSSASQSEQSVREMSSEGEWRAIIDRVINSL